MWRFTLNVGEEVVRRIARNRDTLLTLVDSIAGLEASDDNPVEVIIKPYSYVRSDAQNRYLWGWLYRNISSQLEAAGIVVRSDAGAEYPYTKDLLHDMFKDMFLVKGEIKRGEKIRKLHWSTKELTRKKSGDKPTFGWYVTQVKQFASQYWGIEIPDPHSREYEEIVQELREAA